MLIDWFTVAAQVLNFLVLVWLLKRFLYKPVLDAIEAREKRIAEDLSRAAAQMAAAQLERDRYRTKSVALDAERDAMLAAAANEAKAEHERLLSAARSEADQLRLKQQEALGDERLRLGREIGRIVQDEAFAIARKSLADLAAVSLEERMADVLIRRLASVDGKTREAFASGLTASAAAVVCSSFELPPPQQLAIRHALDDAFGIRGAVHFETSASSVCGIELTAGGQRIAWSISSYLDGLKRKVGSIVDAQASPPP